MYGNMADNDSSKIELPLEKSNLEPILCAYKSCRRPITRSKVQCTVCKLQYHRGCFPRVKDGENANHVCTIENETTDDENAEVEVLKRENLLLQNLVEEIRGKNKALEMNVNLLLEKIHNLEHKERLGYQRQTPSSLSITKPTEALQKTVNINNTETVQRNPTYRQVIQQSIDDVKRTSKPASQTAQNRENLNSQNKTQIFTNEKSNQKKNTDNKSNNVASIRRTSCKKQTRHNH